MSTVLEAAEALLRLCDGARSQDGTGYNKHDAPVVRALLLQPTNEGLHRLKRMLRKYRGQLRDLGFDYGSLTVPETPPTASVPRSADPVRVHVEAPTEAHAVSVPVIEFPTLEQVFSAFPTGFSPRPQQDKAIREIHAAFVGGKRVVCLEMPTGGGKSFICYAFANGLAQLFGDPERGTLFLTIQKALQDQYTRDFPSPMLEVLKGRSNYICEINGAACHEGECRKKNRGILQDCLHYGKVSEAVQLRLPPDAHRCPYWHQLQVCHDHPITLFNFSSFLFQTRINRFGRRSLMIIDEGHNIEAQLMSFVSLELSDYTLSLVNVRIDREISGRDQLVEWLREKDVMGRIDRALKGVDEAAEECPEDLRLAEAEALRELKMKIENFLRYLEATEWVLETVESKDRRGRPQRKIVARPLYAKDFARDLLFRFADRILVMSATILDVGVWTESLGVSRDEVAHVKTPCDFPVENRLIYLDYGGNMGHKYIQQSRPKFVNKVKEILARHRGQRGIIHCHSFELARILMEDVADPRFLFQGNYNGDKRAMLRGLEERPDGVIVAPAMHEGFDLRDDLSRFQIIAKVPWPSLGDKVVRERNARDPRWYGWLTALKLVQSYGRSVRSKDDWATTYIVDAGFESFVSRFGGMLPAWFKEAIRCGPPRDLS